MASILERYEALHPGSRRLALRAGRVFPTGVTHDLRAFSPFPLYAERAEGARKWDVDGNELVDYIGGHGALLLGHNRPEVMEAVKEALSEGTHFGSSHRREVEWAEQVLAMVPCGERVRFTSSGTEATMMALRLARAYTGREHVIKLAEHFHGWHDLVTGRTTPDDPRPESPGVPEGFFDSLTVLPAGDEEALRERLSKRDVAAVIVEPTGAHWGRHPLPASYLVTAREATAQTGALLVLDEVITGFRLAPGGAQERFGIVPDLSTHAKILAGGLPGGCVTGRGDILSMLEMRDGDGDWNRRLRVHHPGTFNANPVSAAAGRAALRLIADGTETTRADATCGRLVRGLNSLFEELDVAASAWAFSSMWHLNLGAPDDGDVHRPADVEWDAPGDPPGVRPDLERPLKCALATHGVDLMGTGGMVSSAHGDAEIDRTLDAFRHSIGDLRADGFLASVLLR